MFIVVFVTIVAKALLIMIGRNKREDTNLLVIWALIEATAVFTHSIHLILFVLIGVKFFYLKNDLQKNITAYFALWAVLPFNYIVNFPLPSIPLLPVNYQRLALIIWILPILPAIYDEARSSGRKAIFDLPVLFLFCMAVVQSFSDTYSDAGFERTTISSIKSVMKFALDIVIPYFLIVHWASSWARLKALFFAIMLSGLALSVFSIFEALTNWNIFRSMGLKGMGWVSGYAPYREFLRAKATFPESIAFGFYIIFSMGITIAVLLRSKRKILIKIFVLMLFLAAVFVTQSRGDYLAAAIMLVAYTYYRVKPTTKFMLIVVMIVVIPVASYIYIQKSPAGPAINVEQVDEYGTLEYRKKLFVALLSLIPQHPFFGNSQFMAEPEMQALRQGQGIIDPVNTYLTMAVQQGLIALFFFLYLIFRAVRVGRQYVAYGYARNNGIWVHLGAAVAGVVIAIAAALANMSFYATIPPIFWFLMAIARSMQLNMKARSRFGSTNDEML